MKCYSLSSNKLRKKLHKYLVRLRGKGGPVRRSVMNPPHPDPLPRRGEGKEPKDWPVERTALLAAGQTDGVLSDINFGEVLPFVAKPKPGLFMNLVARRLRPKPAVASRK